MKKEKIKNPTKRTNSIQRRNRKKKLMLCLSCDNRLVDMVYIQIIFFFAFNIMPRPKVS